MNSLDLNDLLLSKKSFNFDFFFFKKKITVFISFHKAGVLGGKIADRIPYQESSVLAAPLSLTSAKTTHRL